jgi:antitoxin ParD1/3/4
MMLKVSVSICQLLAQAFAPTVEALLLQSSEHLDDEEFEVIADQLAAELAIAVEPNPPVLSDYALSRAGIYEEHP